MFKAFLYDYKQAHSLWKALAKVKPFEWFFIGAILLSGCKFFDYANERNLLSTVIMLVIMFAAVGAELIYSSNKSSLPSKQPQLHFYLTQQVQPVQDMLDKNATGLPINKCVDLLLSECDIMLNRTRPSETFITRIQPIQKFLGVLFGILFSAYIYKGDPVSLPESEISLINQIGTFLSEALRISPDLLPPFVFLAILATIFYFYVVFLIIPYCFIPLLDRDWILAQELKEILTYIKERSSASSTRQKQLFE